MSLLKLQKLDVQCLLIDDHGRFRRCDFVIFAPLPTPLAENESFVVFRLGMLGTGLEIGPLTLLPELHFALDSVVPMEVLELAVGWCPVMHWSKEDTRNNCSVGALVCLLPCLFLSKI